MSRVNLSGYVGHVTIFSWIFTSKRVLFCSIGLGLGLDLVSGWLVCYAHVFVLLSVVIVTVLPLSWLWTYWRILFAHRFYVLVFFLILFIRHVQQTKSASSISGQLFDAR